MMGIRILTFSSLYPNDYQPRHGIFVETRLRKILDNGKIESKVIAPVPWFPIENKFAAKYSVYSKIKKYESRHEIDVYHPRYLVIPKIGMILAPFLMALSVLPTLKAILNKGYDFELIDAHYFYPDGVAAVILGKILKKQVIITARGSDINLIAKYMVPRKMILWAARNASAVATVSNALKNAMVDLGANPSQISVLPNGIDRDIFRPSKSREELRRKLHLNGNVLLSVGNLVQLKGHDLIIQSLIDLDGYHLLIIGKGPEEKRLKHLVSDKCLDNRVTFLGEKNQRELVDYYNAVDAVVLASSREGMPNVLLESIACGTPVVATDVGGVKEIVTSLNQGVLAPERTVRGVRESIQKLFKNYPDRSVVSDNSKHFSWESTVNNLVGIIENSVSRASGEEK